MFHLTQYVSKLSHVLLDDDMRFDCQLRRQYFQHYAKSIINSIWEGKFSWLISEDGPIFDTQVKLEEVNLPSIPTQLEFWTTTLRGKHVLCHIDKAALIGAFYSNKAIFKEVGREVCTILDVALSRGASEAIVESFYGVMRKQQQSGVQQNSTLGLHTKLV